MIDEPVLPMVRCPLCNELLEQESQGQHGKDWGSMPIGVLYEPESLPHHEREAVNRAIKAGIRFPVCDACFEKALADADEDGVIRLAFYKKLHAPVGGWLVMDELLKRNGD